MFTDTKTEKKKSFLCQYTIYSLSRQLSGICVVLVSHHLATLQAIGIFVYSYKMVMLIAGDSYDVGSFGWSFYTCCGSTIVLGMACTVLVIHGLVVRRKSRWQQYHIIN